MSAAPQISWDKQPKAPPQVQWDEEKPKTKPQEGFLSKALHAVNPLGFVSDVSEGFGKVGDWAERKRNEAEEKNLGGIAKTGKSTQPIPAYTPAAGYDLAMRAAKTASGLTSPKSLAITGAAAVAPEIVGPALIGHGLYTAASNAKRAIGGDPEAAQSALGGAAEAVGGGAATTAALAPGTPKTFTRNALSAANKAIIKGEPPNALVPEAQKAFTQAIQPGVNIPRAQESIQIAGPRMKQVMEQNGLNLRRETGADAVPVTKKALDVIKASKQAVHAAIEDRLGPIAELQPDTSAVADAMEQSISGRTQRQFPKDAEAIRKRADTYRGNLSLREIENSIQDANNELRNYYKRPGGTDSPTPAHTDATLAEVKTLRSLLDEKVESLSGAGVKDLKREYGALRDVERATAKQHAIATRTKEGGLWEGLSYLHAAGDLLSGNALGAARAGGAITVGRMLKTLRNPDFLIEQSFHGPNAFKAAEPIAAHTGPPPPRGLLPTPKEPIQGEAVEEPRQPGPRPVPNAAYQPPQLTEFAGRQPGSPPPATRTQETTLPPDETRLGPTGQGGIRIPIKGMLPAAREAAGIPTPPAPKPKYTPSEKAETMSAPAKDYGPEFNAQQRQEEISRHEAILRNPKATAEERTIATDRLRDAKDPGFYQSALKAAKEPEPVETKIKGITAEEKKAPRPKREVMPPVELRHSLQEIEEAEGLLNQESGMLASGDRPGRYYDMESDQFNPEGHMPSRSTSAAKGITFGGTWRGVTGGRQGFPLMHEHPEWGPEQVQKALRNKDSAFYKRMMESAIEFVNRGKNVEAEERAAIQEEPESELPARSADTMSEAIAMSSPSGSMSARAKAAAMERLGKQLFGEQGLQKPTGPPEPTEAETMLRRAKELRGIAERGMKPRAYLAEAERLEEQAKNLLPGMGEHIRAQENGGGLTEETSGGKSSDVQTRSNADAVARNRPQIAADNLRRAKERGIETTPGGNIVLYHATRSGKQIRASGEFPIGTYFGAYEETSKEFMGRGTQQHGPVEIMKIEVPAGLVMNSGDYYTANEPVPLKEAGKKR